MTLINQIIILKVKTKTTKSDVHFIPKIYMEKKKGMT